jgi:hypothetical protein
MVHETAFNQNVRNEPPQRDVVSGLHVVSGIFDRVSEILEEQCWQTRFQPLVDAVHNALLICVDVVRRVESRR